MSIYARAKPIPEPRRADHHICLRCGVQVIRNADRWFGYCRDCKSYAKADGLMGAS